MTINPKATKWLEARALDPENASRMGLYTAAELGVIVSRQSPHDRLTEIGIRKVKFYDTGRLGDLHLTFDDRIRAFV